MGNLEIALCCTMVSWFCTASIATTDDNFICVALDWWPSSKCNYDHCPWGQAGIFTLDLENKVLSNAVKAFNPLRIRIGGSLHDQLVYQVGNTSSQSCRPFQHKKDGLLGYSAGYLTMETWDQLNQFANQTRAKVTFGLNALTGRRSPSGNGSILWVGAWNLHNALDLMNSYEINSISLLISGNELCSNGVDAKVGAEQYGKDMIVLKKLVKKLYPDPNTEPKLLGPGGFLDERWFKTYLTVFGRRVISGYLQPWFRHDSQYLDQIAQVYGYLSSTIKEYGPWTDAWVGESGGAYNVKARRESKIVSHSFSDGFWFLDQLGMSSSFNHKVFCRQSLVGGNYGLLNATTFVPNPDYYTIKILPQKLFVFSYSHCSKRKLVIALLLMNLSNSTTFKVVVSNVGNPHEHSSRGTTQREEYHLTPRDGNIRSSVVRLNGTPMVITDSPNIPPMNPKLVDPSLPITVAPSSIVFAILRDFNARACS
ncbi:hypothetical protein MANES_05G107950v8 [Manihot esculenta]|uniref:Uncharacterized protein n=1 Tax=Manihot esculenta TaxID=3983 RepID=A0ACB7HN70_MANES|nr:hypothetical protein MANES_05G107950v8 [Manihot esculenta]